jgi:hypothetical protein
LINQMRLFLDSADFYWNYWVVAFGPERQQELLSKIGLEDMDWRGLTITLVITVGGVSLLYGLMFVLKNRRPPADPLVRSYMKFKRKLKQSGLDTSDIEGPVDLLSRIQLERPDLAQEAEGIIHQYIYARYQTDMPATSVTSFRKRVKHFSPRQTKKSPAMQG